MLFGRYNTAPTPMLPNWPAQEVVFLEVAVHERQIQIGAKLSFESRNVDAGQLDYRNTDLESGETFMNSANRRRKPQSVGVRTFSL